ncbi:SAC3 domain-containing protein 1 [Boleophthalmus pectinirostris]|uniref:SAC3 domain-containing protein 1 n=1 Tax=Boleophthalmus pectinirostris TaxID=150288 RepID=UPI000A1C26AD|nr:SAC3 domain-containing protein 1 [Boleophthalmus pectinirostris]
MNRRRTRRTHHSLHCSPNAERRAETDEWKTSSQKSWRDRGNKENTLETPVEERIPKGTCQTMCPAFEMRQRQAQHRLHQYEILRGTAKDRQPRADPLRTVKEYARPAAGKDSTNPSDLRAPDVLQKTVRYLLDEIATSPNLHPWTEVYGFVFDRLRAVKQDMIIQRLSGTECVTILEQSVCFLVYASYRLCGEPLRHFDPKINDMHVQENLSWLLDCYVSSSAPNDHRKEYEALNLLYNLGCTKALQRVMQLPEGLRCAPDISLALSINHAYLERNPVRLLRLAKKLNFLQTCALHRHLTSCRRDLLLIYSHGFSSRNCRFPLEKLSDLLDLDTCYTTQYCQLYGVEINLENKVVFTKSAFAEPEQGKGQCLQYHNTKTEKLKLILMGCKVHDSL